MMNKSTAIMLAILAFLLGLLIGYQWGYNAGEKVEVEVETEETNKNSTQTPTPNPENSFIYNTESGYFGTLTLSGYVELVERENNIKYALFVFDDINNTALDQFMETNSGNSFAGENKVGIGCQEQDPKRIFYENFADSGEIQGSITGGDYDLLMNSSKDSKVELKMTRDIYTSGRGAPECYSHFRNFDVI